MRSRARRPAIVGEGRVCGSRAGRLGRGRVACAWGRCVARAARSSSRGGSRKRTGWRRSRVDGAFEARSRVVHVAGRVDVRADDRVERRLWKMVSKMRSDEPVKIVGVLRNWGADLRWAGLAFCGRRARSNSRCIDSSRLTCGCTRNARASHLRHLQKYTVGTRTPRVSSRAFRRA